MTCFWNLESSYPPPPIKTHRRKVYRYQKVDYECTKDLNGFHIFDNLIHPSFRTLRGGGRGGLVVEHRSPKREVGSSILSRVAVLYP